MSAPNLTRASVAETLGIEKPARKRVKRFGRRLVWVPLAVLAAGSGAVLLTRGDDGGDVQYVTEAARRGDLRVTVTATGTLEPTNQVEVGSEVSGTVRTVEVDEDDHVRKGQVLARLDTSKLQAQARQQQASLASAEARLLQVQATRREAQGQLARFEQVFQRSGGKVPSEQELDTARANTQRAEADEAEAVAAIAQARASLAAVTTDVAKGVIRSPIDGIVLERAVDPGQTVAASFQAPVLFKIAQGLTRMEVRVDVDEADVAQVKEGHPASFTVDAHPARTFEARITKVRSASQTTDGVVTYEAILSVENHDLSLRPGMTATADLTVQAVLDALLVPNTALSFSPEPAQAGPSTGSGGQPSAGGLVSRLMPRPPMGRRPAAGNAAGAAASSTQRNQRVYTLRDGQPVAVAVDVGATDGRNTEIVGGSLQAGTPVIVSAARKES